MWSCRLVLCVYIETGVWIRVACTCVYIEVLRRIGMDVCTRVGVEVSRCVSLGVYAKMSVEVLRTC